MRENHEICRTLGDCEPKSKGESEQTGKKWYSSRACLIPNRAAVPSRKLAESWKLKGFEKARLNWPNLHASAIKSAHKQPKKISIKPILKEMKKERNVKSQCNQRIKWNSSVR